MVFLGLGFFELLFLGIWIFGIIDVLITPAEEIRSLQKVLWFLIVLLILPGFWLLGTVLWFVYGRPRASVPAGVAPNRSLGGGPRRGPRRSVAPDDDVDFLRSLNRPPDGPSTSV